MINNLVYGDKIRQMFVVALATVGRSRSALVEYMTSKADYAFELSNKLTASDARQAHAHLAIELLMFSAAI